MQRYSLYIFLGYIVNIIALLLIMQDFSYGALIYSMFFSIFLTPLSATALILLFEIIFPVFNKS